MALCREGIFDADRGADLRKAVELACQDQWEERGVKDRYVDSAASDLPVEPHLPEKCLDAVGCRVSPSLLYLKSPHELLVVQI